MKFILPDSFEEKIVITEITSEIEQALDKLLNISIYYANKNNINMGYFVLTKTDGIYSITSKDMN